MSGIRLGGVARIVVISPPVTALGGASTPFGDPQVYRWRSDDAPGVMDAYTDFDNFTEADQCHNPVLSPDGTKILFEILQTATGFREIWVTDNVIGSTPTPLIQDASNYVIHPSWGPDSDTFVYVHCVGGALQAGAVMKDTVSAIGSPATLKTPTAGWGCFRPQFNFDGTRVAYIMDKDIGAGCDLRVMDDDGSNDAAIDATLTGYRGNQPAQFGWANAANIICYENGASGSNAAYVINDDGSGQVQINANGDAAGGDVRVTGMPWAPDDSYVIVTSNLGLGYYSVIRAELDGSDTTALGSNGPRNQVWFQGALVFENRIWFIENTDSGGDGKLSYMALDGTGYVQAFSANAGTEIYPFTGGDGFYYN